jgi:hypothetical protein
MDRCPTAGAPIASLPPKVLKEDPQVGGGLSPRDRRPHASAAPDSRHDCAQATWNEACPKTGCSDKSRVMDVLRRQGSEQRDARGRWLPGTTPTGARPWRKGQVPNPSGKGGAYHEMQRLAREYTPRGTEILREIADDPNEDSRNRIVAIGMLFDRAWGKPREYDPQAEAREEQNKSSFDPRRYTEEELEVIEAGLRMTLTGGSAPAGPAVIPPHNRYGATRS